ncbi:MAG: hypothetical protein WC584_02830 [Candidatus Pacearchaeota archaeon]
MKTIDKKVVLGWVGFMSAGLAFNNLANDNLLLEQAYVSGAMMLSTIPLVGYLLCQIGKSDVNLSKYSKEIK